MAKVAIIGVGELGHSIGHILELAGHDLVYWDKDEAKVYELGKIPLSLPETISSVDFIFFCIPSWSVHEALAFGSRYIKKNTIVISPTKGLNNQSHKTVDEVFKKMLPPGIPLVILGGAMIAEEITHNKFGIAMIASSNAKAIKKVSELFSNSSIALETSSDVRGVVLAGVLKNIFAIGMGVADGLRLGDNAKGFLFSQALKEMVSLNQALGGRRSTALEVPLVADFSATGFSRHSLNHQVGVELVNNAETKKVSEGLVSINSLVKIIGQRKLKTYPFLYSIARIVIGRVPAKESIDDLLKIFIGSL